MMDSTTKAVISVLPLCRSPSTLEGCISPHPSDFSQALSRSNSDTVVPNARISVLGSPSAGPTITQAVRNFLPIQRYTALIMFASCG